MPSPLKAGAACLLLLTAACADIALRNEVDVFLDAYEQEYQDLYYAWSEAEWASNTHIVEGDTTNAARTRRTHEAYVEFVGSEENIDQIRSYLDLRDELTSLQVMQLEKMLYMAAEGPQTIPDLVAERIAAEAEQVEDLFGFEYRLRGRPITPNEMDQLLRTATDLSERRAVWEAS